jgi:6-phosphogluconolactonase
MLLGRVDVKESLSRKVSKWLLKAAAVACTLNFVLAAEMIQAQGRPSTPEGVALYASLGPELTHYEVSADQATLTKRDSVTLPGTVQYAWPHPSGRYLYVVWSGGQGDSSKLQGISAFRVEPGSGTLHLIGQPVPLKYRPIHITVDHDGTHLLIVYNIPATVSGYNIAPDGGIGSEVKEPANLDMGIYVHQVRVEPSNKTVIIVARGNYEGKHDPGALKIFNYKDGVLTNRTSIAPDGGIEFNPRHLDFAKSQPWIFVSLEPQDKLQVYRLSEDGTPGGRPLFSKTTLANPSDVPIEHRQLTGTVHLHPNGRVVYAANRATGTIKFQGKQVWAGGENSIAVFDINQKTGEPTLVQDADTHGMVPRTFALDPSGRILVAANQNPRLVRHGDTLTTVPASLAMFRVRPDGKLDFVRTYDVDATERGNLFWMGIVSVPR